MSSVVDLALPKEHSLPAAQNPEQLSRKPLSHSVPVALRGCPTHSLLLTGTGTLLGSSLSSHSPQPITKGLGDWDQSRTHAGFEG